jgi:hypothetical protein
MPFAPAVLDRAAPDIFEGYDRGRIAAEFMTITFSVRPAWRDRIPAVVHVDGTARPQVVRREVNPRYYRVIEGFEALTGLPVVLNTSFNLHEEPIVASPDDALRAFGEGRLDVLVMGDLVLSHDSAILAAAGTARSIGRYGVSSAQALSGKAGMVTVCSRPCCAYSSTARVQASLSGNSAISSASYCPMVM